MTTQEELDQTDVLLRGAKPHFRMTDHKAIRYGRVPKYRHKPKFKRGVFRINLPLGRPHYDWHG